MHSSDDSGARFVPARHEVLYFRRGEEPRAKSQKDGESASNRVREPLRQK